MPPVPICREPLILYRMNSRESSLHVEPSVETPETERDVRVPTIDIVRHGQTEYKELKDPSFAFNPDAPDFKLDAEHLDLTEEGIRNIYETAQQLVTAIDKEHEVVVLETSPNFRARSSNLIIERVLLENGITVLNSGQAQREGKSNGPKQARALAQIEFNDPNFRPVWITEDQRYRSENPARLTERPRHAHEAIAARLGKEIPDIFSKDHDQLDVGFRRWLRHMINIDRHLSQSTKESEALQGKRIRIVATTHEEVPDQFVHDALGSQTNLAKGQMLEIQPESMLQSNESIQAKVRLFAKDDTPDSTGDVAITYQPKKA